MSTDTTVYQLFRKPSKSGTKDWAIGVGPAGSVRIRSCATGRTARLEEIPPANFVDPQSEIEKRIAAKRAEGYEPIGTATMNGGRLQRRPPSPPPVQPGIDWEIFQPIERVALLGHLQSVALRLNTGPLADRVVLEGSVLFVYGSPPWALGIGAEGGLRSDGRGGGKVLDQHGALPRLVLVELCRTFPECVQFATADGTSLIPRLTRDDPLFAPVAGNWDLITELGARLGLCLGVQQLRAFGAKADEAFWF